MKTNIANIRKDYTRGGLRRKDLNENPLVQFKKWLEEAISSQVDEPTAVLVGTVSPEGRPSTR